MTCKYGLAIIEYWGWTPPIMVTTAHKDYLIANYIVLVRCTDTINRFFKRKLVTEIVGKYLETKNEDKINV